MFEVYGYTKNMRPDYQQQIIGAIGQTEARKRRSLGVITPERLGGSDMAPDRHPGAQGWTPGPRWGLLTIADSAKMHLMEEL